MKFAPRLALLIAVAFTCISCDQVTKTIAKAELKGQPPQSYLGDSVRLTYAENPGAFLSVGSDLPESVRSWLLSGLSALLVLGMSVAVLRGSAMSRSQVLGMALVAAGGAGNLIDRLAYGSVRDFLNLGVGPLRTGIFNGADVAITVGVVMFGMAQCKGRGV